MSAMLLSPPRVSPAVRCHGGGVQPDAGGAAATGLDSLVALDYTPKDLVSSCFRRPHALEALIRDQ